MKKITQLERQITTGSGKLPDRIEKHDGKLFGYYAGEKIEVKKSVLVQDLDRYFSNIKEVENVTVFDDETDLKAEGIIRVGHYEMMPDMTEITQVVDIFDEGEQ